MRPASPTDCQTKGVNLFDCGACLRDDHNCYAGESVADVTLASVCVLNAKTPLCDSYCDIETFVSYVYDLMCDLDGQCVQVDEVHCGNYKCTTNPNECLTSCVDTSQCAGFGLVCSDGKCG